MEKKKECEIVQDLLLSYVDDVLNNESKKLVEKHLIECSVCKKRLDEIRQDMKKNESNQKKEIDYLKKIRRRARIKSIIIAIGIIFLLFFSFYLYKFVIISSIANKGYKTLQTGNIYREIRDGIDAEGEVLVKKQYLKDGKCKTVEEIYSNNGKEIKKVSYTELNSNETITIIEEEKKVIKEKGKFQEGINSNKLYVPWILDLKEHLIVRLGFAFVMSIDTDYYAMGKEYYVIRNQFENTQKWELWIDKETGLPIRNINLNGNVSYFSGTDVIKDIRDNIREYRYQVGVVTEADVQIPDLSNYEITYINQDDLPKEN